MIAKNNFVAVLDVCAEELKDQLLLILVGALSFSLHEDFNDALVELSRGDLLFLMLLSALKDCDAEMSSILIKAAGRISLFPRIEGYMVHKMNMELAVTKQDLERALEFARNLDESGFTEVPEHILRYIENLSQLCEIHYTENETDVSSSEQEDMKPPQPEREIPRTQQINESPQEPDENTPIQQESTAPQQMDVNPRPVLLRHIQLSHLLLFIFFYLLIANRIPVKSQMMANSQLQNLPAQVQRTEVHMINQFWRAIESDDKNSVEEAIRHGLNVNSNGDSPLISAIRKGAVEVSRALIAAGAEVDTVDRDGNPALLLAAKANSEMLVSLLLEAGADPNMKGKDGDAPLHHAARAGSDAILVQLLEVGINPNIKGKDDETPLHLAAEAGHSDTAMLLANKGANINEKGQWDRTPLHNAARKGHLSIVKLLTTLSAEVSCKDQSGYTPLHLAALNGHLECMKHLTSLKAEVDSKNQYRNTPLHFAALNGHLECVKHLTSMKADVNSKSRYGYTPLHWAAQEGHLECVKLLNTHGADVNARSRGGTPLSLSQHHIHVAEYLRSVGGRI